jgi:hypothetical protein
MSDPLGEVLAEFRELIGVIDQASVLAQRAQADAQEAHGAYREAGTGSKRPDITRAQVDARTAAEKAGKTARLLAEAANAFADYVNIIAPGTAPARYSDPEATPSGESLAAETSSRRSRLESLLAAMSVDADDKQEAVTTVTADLASGARIAFRDISHAHGPRGAVTATPPREGDPSDAMPGTAVGEFASAVMFSALAVAVATKGVRDRLSHRHEEEQEVDHQE